MNYRCSIKSDGWAITSMETNHSRDCSSTCRVGVKQAAALREVRGSVLSRSGKGSAFDLASSISSHLPPQQRPQMSGSWMSKLAKQVSIEDENTQRSEYGYLVAWAKLFVSKNVGGFVAICEKFSDRHGEPIHYYRTWKQVDGEVVESPDQGRHPRPTGQCHFEFLYITNPVAHELTAVMQGIVSLDGATCPRFGGVALVQGTRVRGTNIPLGVMFCLTEDGDSHYRALRYLLQRCPMIAVKDVVIVSDR